ncbi:hypothetical protein OIU83_16835 [Flavobacterium sp. LS1R49]|uniref:Uncharacterized protein n=1 Tax=Flavobacterium shii TaxID=2987687 RepID=A0A9X3BYU7_9FLAO|nr:hypothetical protein [Flavobacterium shii]MCV9929335.1 hypothetical protein [Flavobacterium shii]
MKKKLEADLISIAHRILKLKNKSDINQLYLETQKLYEKLAVLKFIDENFEDAKPTIGRREIDSTIETSFKKEEVIQPEKALAIEEPIVKAAIIVNEVVETPAEEIPEPIAEIESKPEEVSEPIIEIPEPEIEPTEPNEPEVEEIKAEEPVKEEKVEEVAETPIPDFIPSFELKEEAKDETPEKSDVVHISFEDLMGIDYSNAQFVKVDSFEAVSPTPTPPAPTELKEKKKEVAATAVLEEPKPVSLNEKLSKGFHVDLNDRIAFTKHLFGNSPEDYNRVLNQLITFDSFSEANEFLESMVKPDYNNWEGKDEYAERFVGIIEKKFS